MSLAEPSAFAAAYARHHAAVQRAALRVLGDHAAAQDVAQDVFLRLWRRPERFDATRGDLGPYLRLMARSRALDLWREGRAAGRAASRLELLEPTRQAGRDEPAAELMRSGDRARLRAALAELPPAQREALVLSYWGGLTAREIAARGGVPVGTVKSRVRLGLRRLRALVEPVDRPGLALAA